jgi:inner membrane protein
MDNVTHTVTGLVLAQAGLGRMTPHGATLLVLAANAPDIDIVMATQGALRYFECHRGYTHCLLALPVMALISVLVTSLIFRQRLPWLRATLIACVGVGSHLLLDWTNSYGIRLLLPFSSRWSYGNLNSLPDFVMFAMLLFAVIWPLFERFVVGEMGGKGKREGRGSGLAIAVLLALVFFDAGREVLRRQAIAKFSRAPEGQEQPLAVSALPTSVNPFTWTVIAQNAASYRIVETKLLQPADEAISSRTVYKVSDDPALQAAAQSEPFHYFRYFARFPVWSRDVVTLHGNKYTRIELTDLRFGSPGSGSFHSVALVDSKLRVIQSRFSFSPQPVPDTP